MKKLISVDIDLTILPECKIMPKEIIDYFHYLHSLGHIIVLNTGRPVPGAYNYYLEFNGDCILASDNGTRIINPLDKTFKPIINGMDTPRLQSFLEEISDDIYMSMCLDNHDLYMNDESLVPFWMFHKFDDSVFYIGKDFYKHFKNPISLLNLWIKKDCVNHMLKIKEKYSEFDLFDWGESSTHHAFELTNKGGNKSFPIKMLSEKYRIPYENIYCFGDALNDLAMFVDGVNSVAMLNGCEEIKQKAKNVTSLDCDHFGVIDYLKKEKHKNSSF